MIVRVNMRSKWLTETTFTGENEWCSISRAHQIPGVSAGTHISARSSVMVRPEPYRTWALTRSLTLVRVILALTWAKIGTLNYARN